MTKAAKIFAVLAALECFGIMVLEMFYWEKAGMNVDPALSAEFLTQTVSMAANQGLYNGFLGLGIIVGIVFHFLRYTCSDIRCLQSGYSYYI